MGLAKSLALKGGGLIAAVVLIGFLASKTGVLRRFSEGLGNIGSSIGLGVGTGVANIPRGVIEGFGNVFQTSGGEDPFGLKKLWNDFLGNFGVECTGGGLTGSCQAKGESANPKDDRDASGVNVNPQLDNPNKTNSVLGNYRGLPTGTKLSNYPSGASRTVSKGGGFSVGISKNKGARQGSFNRAQSAARKRAKARKSGKCFNVDLETGGVGQIIYRQFGVIGLHG